MTWTLRDARRERAITDKIDAADDRSAAILAGAFIQDRLIKALTAQFRNDSRTLKKVLKGYGPLSTFQGQIDIAFLLRIIEEETKDKLHKIRDVRIFSRIS
jgi:hypothetical protein